MNSADASAEARRIIDLVKTNFVRSDGSLYLERERDHIVANHIFPDLGDVAPFLLYFNEDEFVEKQVNVYLTYLQRGYLVSEFPTLGLSGLVKSYEYTDLILGLAMINEMRPTEKYRCTLQLTLDAARRAFDYEGELRSLFSFRTGFRLPIIDTRDATFIECLIAVHAIDQDPRHIDAANNVFKRLLDTKFYRENGLFADYEPTNAFARLLMYGKTKTQSATVCKNNTNALFAFLELYKITQNDEVLKVIDGLVESLASKCMNVRGGMVERFTPGRHPDRGFLTASFPVIDFLCDYGFAVPSRSESSKNTACKIADFWLVNQGRTGLFPLREGEKGSFLDSETDMAVALYKLAEVSGQQHYRNAAEKCIDGILTYHGKHDYVLSVDVDSGEILGYEQRTKFLCLFLKALIMIIESEEHLSLMANHKLVELLKDR